MKESHKFAIVLGIISALATVAVAAAAVFLYFDKKRKDDEEMQRYIDCSIQ